MNITPEQLVQDSLHKLTPIVTAPEEDVRQPDWSKPSLAVIASDGKGNGLVLFDVGPHLQQWREDLGSSLKDLGLDDAPCGISVWEGKVVGSTSYYGETDAWLDGAFREPTEEEWDYINSGDCPWDLEDYFCEPGQCCRRDTDNDGACDRHSAPGVTRTIRLFSRGLS